MQSRYYDPAIGRFISADIPTVAIADPTTVTDKNLFAYCDNNPVVRVDDGGQFWDTIFDVVSLAISIVDVCSNPSSGWAWAGLAGDVVDLVPFVTGVGEGIKAARTVDKVVDTVDAASDLTRVADTTTSTIGTGWKVGDDISNLTKKGNVPTWNTVRNRYWKNEAFYNPSGYTTSNLARMKQGKPPLVMFDNKKMYPMELHHIIPQRYGGPNTYSNLMPLAPWEHAQVDPCRFFKP